MNRLNSALVVRAKTGESDLSTAQWMAPNVAPLLWFIAMKLCTDIHGPQRVNPNDFGALQTFPLTPTTGSNKTQSRHAPPAGSDEKEHSTETFFLIHSY